jgi:hypothetical protein
LEEFLVEQDIVIPGNDNLVLVWLRGKPGELGLHFVEASDFCEISGVN